MSLIVIVHLLNILCEIPEEITSTKGSIVHSKFQTRGDDQALSHEEIYHARRSINEALRTDLFFVIH